MMSFGRRRSLTGCPVFIACIACGILTATLGATPAFGSSGDDQHRKVTKLADGVYAIEHPDLPYVNGSGNTTVIIGAREVFVIDSCGTPAMARGDIALIRQWTDKPVGYLLNTHFHND